MTSAPSRRAPAPSIDIQVQSPLWQAEPAAEQKAPTAGPAAPSEDMPGAEAKPLVKGVKPAAPKASLSRSAGRVISS